MSTDASLRDALRVPAGPVSTAGFDPGGKPLSPKSHRAAHDPAELADLQERLWAESTVGGRRRVLLVLQGMDTAGKGGVVNHAVGLFGPIGVEYTGFKKPTEQEAKHDFLWRIRKRLPGPGPVARFRAEVRVAIRAAPTRPTRHESRREHARTPLRSMDLGGGSCPGAAHWTEDPG